MIYSPSMLKAAIQTIKSYWNQNPPATLDPSPERDAIVTFLMCEAFECRYAPELARVLRTAADDIRRGRHLRPGHELLPGE